MTRTGFAAAKINLALHVTGQRPDGYHLLDSLVAFAGVGDRLRAEPASGLSLTITGPEGDDLAVTDNLVLRAAQALGSAGQGTDLVLEKYLPVASGIGGGSADAAAALHLLAGLWGCPLPDASAVLALGADVPVCLAGRACRMAGIGEQLSPVPPLPPVWAVLANPRIAVATPAVFAAMTRRDNAPLPAQIPAFGDAAALAGWLAVQRNDLEPAAIRIAPVVAEVLAALGQLPGALLRRMSGSGATCFALFADAATAQAGAERLRAGQPGWWVAAARLGDSPDGPVI